MNKVLTHLKNNFVIYLVLIACLIVALIAFFYTSKREQVVTDKLDSSMYTPVDIAGIDFLFSDPEPKLLLISSDSCTATMEYSKTLNYEMLRYDYKVYYLNLDNIDMESEEYKNFIKKLDLDYDQKGEKGKFYEFMGLTPMTVIIKNKKMVYGYIGKMSGNSLSAITERYGVSHGVVHG